MGVSLWGVLPSPKATARQEVPCTRTYGIEANEYYQKYEPKARAGGGRRLMSKIRKGFTRLTKNPACPFAVGGYESSRETRNRQRLMRNPAVPCMVTYRESKQKSAEGIVPGACRRGRPERRKE